MRVRNIPVARYLGYQGCRHDKLHKVPGNTVLVEFEKKITHQDPLRTPLPVQAVPRRSYSGAHDITIGEHSLRDCKNEVVNFQKIKINACINPNVGH